MYIYNCTLLACLGPRRNGQWKSDGYNFNAGQSAGTVDVVPSDPTILPIAPHYGEKPLLNVEIAGYQPSKSKLTSEVESCGGLFICLFTFCKMCCCYSHFRRHLRRESLSNSG